MTTMVGRDRADAIRRISLRLYDEAAACAAQRGLIIADTKFEFGVRKDELMLIDEVLTPDSSRFWPMDGYASGGPQPSFDKQYVRDYLESLRWPKQPPAPELPPEVVRKTTEKYREALTRLAGLQPAAPEPASAKSASWFPGDYGSGPQSNNNQRTAHELHHLSSRRLAQSFAHSGDWVQH